MKRTALLAILSYLVITSYAQITQDTISLDEILVISPANPVEFKEISATVHIISRDQISNSPVESLDGLLKVYGGADIRSRGAMGVQSDINLRGGTFDQGLIMIDGISLNDPQTGHNNLNQAIDLDNVEKIEIFEGPGTRWFGANSFSGGINIISRKPDGNSMRASVMGGQYGYFSGSLSADYSLGNLKNRTSVGFRRSNGYIKNTDFNIINAVHNSSYNTRSGVISVNLGILDKGFGANSFYTPQYPDQYEHIRTYNTSALFETGSKIKFKANAYWRRNFDRFELFREDNNWYKKQGDVYIMEGDTAGYPTPGGLYPYFGHNYHRTDIIGADAALKFNSKLGSTSVGLGLKSESIVSNVLGKPMSDTIFIDGSDGYYTKSYKRYNASFSLNQYYTIKRFSVSAGLLVNYSDDYGTHVSPGINLGYFVTENVKVFASANHALRLPTFTDLFYQGPSNISNPELVPETSVSVESGIKYFKHSFNTSLSGFYRYGSNIIDWIKYSPEEKWQSANLSNLITYGFSFSANRHFNKGFVKYGGIKYTWLNSEKDNGDIISLYALDYLNHNLNLFLSHNILKNFSASWTATIQKRNGSYIDYESGTKTDYSLVCLINLKLVYKVKNFEFSLYGSNLLNRKYYDIGNVEQPSLWIIGGVKVDVFRKN